MNTLLTYANYAYRYQQRQCLASAEALGEFDRILALGPRDIDAHFRQTHREILKYQRGDGYWLWKPYLIRETLKGMREGDVLFYLDAGGLFTGSIQPALALHESLPQDIILFRLGFPEKYWTKRDAFILMDCDTPEHKNSPQRQAGYSSWKKTRFTMQFLDELIAYSTDARMITDQENVCGKPNDPDFKSHRHDQSIFSLLSKKHGLQACLMVDDQAASISAVTEPTCRDFIKMMRWQQVPLLTRKWVGLRKLADRMMLGRC